MGSCLSLQDSDDEQRSRRRRRYESTGPVVINTAVVIPQYARSSSAPPRTNRGQSGPKAYYGEYKCQYCGRFWASTLSWKNKYQCCKRCGRDVYPMNQREVQPSDIKREEGKNKEHAKELCQQCKQLGYYCGKVIDVRNVQSQQSKQLSSYRGKVNNVRSVRSQATRRKCYR